MGSIRRPSWRVLRRSAVVAAVAVAGLAATAAGVQGAGAQAAERILSFDVDLRIEPTGQLVVTEVIAYDFGDDSRHGILRYVPVRSRFDDTYDRVYPLHLDSVTGSPGTPVQYEVEDSGSNKQIKIGDPDRTVTGRHTYTLVYRVEGALNGFEDHDELYWNGIGPDWDAPIERATVRVRAPAAVGQIACFAGPSGSNLPCSESSRDGDTALFSEGSMGPREALTVVVGFPRGAVPTPSPVLDERWTPARAFSVTPATVVPTAGLLALGVALVGGLAWREGRDRRFIGSPVDVAFGTAGDREQTVPLLERPLTPVEFVPPDRLRPGQVGTLIDEVANPLDVTATIVDLAVRGYLRIEEIPKEGWFGKADWRLVNLKAPDDLRPYEALLHSGLFESGGEDGSVKLSDLRDTFATRLGRVQEALYVDAVDEGWFVARPDKVRSRWTWLGVAVAIAGGILVVAAAARTRYGLVPVPIVVAGLLLSVCARRMPRRTARGVGVLRRVQGFRRFIDESETERARFAERQNLFSEYLPYAIVFGCTEKWARAFAGLDGAVPQTSWYYGTHPFTAHTFGGAIDNFTVSTAGTIASTPSGSGSSGFGGGGFSGGGGGGGGGGSW